MTNTPSPEAVEAAMNYAREMSQLVPPTLKWAAACDALYKLRTPDDDCTCQTCARILAAEVERLRKEIAFEQEKYKKLSEIASKALWPYPIPNIEQDEEQKIQ